MSNNAWEFETRIVNSIHPDGDCGHLILYLGFEDMTDEEVLETFYREGGDEGGACYCEHDCCGHKFFMPPVIHRTTEGAIFVTQGWGTNV